jgi:hypothetical protein
VACARELILGAIRVAREEGDRRQGLERPGLAPTIADRPVEGEGVFQVRLGPVEIPSEHGDPPSTTPRFGFAALVPKLVEHGDRVVEDFDRGVVVTFHLLYLAEQ